MEDYKIRYEEALERAKDIKSGKVKLDEGEPVTDYIFPELKESEDERIKNGLIALLRFGLEDGSAIAPGFNETKEQALAWLEKQGKQKPVTIDIDKMVDDYVNNNERGNEEFGTPVNCMIRAYRQGLNDAIGKVVLNPAWLEKQGQKETLCDKCRKEQPSHSCQDITELGRCALEKQGEQKSVDKVEPKFKVGEWITNSIETVQITGYDIDYGYQVDYKGNLQHRDTDIIEKEYHLWTIEDAKDGDVLTNGKMIVIFKHFEEPSYREHIVAYIGLDTNGDIQITDGIWELGIDKAKPAIKEQCDLLFQKIHEAGYKWDAEKKELKKIEQKSAWSEEDEKMFDEVINNLHNYIFKSDNTYFYIDCDKHITWLKSFKDRVQPQPKQDWSEEDERIRNAIINDIAAEKNTCYSKIGKGICDKQINWLKSLKDRCASQL